MKGLIFGILWYFIRQNEIVHFVYFIQGVQRRHTWMSLGWDVYQICVRKSLTSISDLQ